MEGAVNVVMNDLQGFYSHLFLLDKAAGVWKPVINLSSPNHFLTIRIFKMETVASVPYFHVLRKVM